MLVGIFGPYFEFSLKYITLNTLVNTIYKFELILESKSKY